MARFLIRIFVAVMRQCGYPYTFVLACDANLLQTMAATGAAWWADQARAYWADSTCRDISISKNYNMISRLCCTPNSALTKIAACRGVSMLVPTIYPMPFSNRSFVGCNHPLIGDLPEKTRMEFYRLSATIRVVDRRTEKEICCLISNGQLMPQKTQLAA